MGDLDREVAPNKGETHMMNSNGERLQALGLLLVAECLQEAIKKVQ